MAFFQCQESAMMILMKLEDTSPFDEVAREIQKVGDKIEAATGLTLTTSSTAEKEEESEEPANKKERIEDGNHDHDNDPSPPTTNA